MKLKNVILTLSAFVLLTSSGSVIAQTDSSGKYYAYAHLYSDDTYTEYVSSVFCWIKNPSNSSITYPSDSLTKWVKSIFKHNYPDVKVRKCVCKFTRADGSYYTLQQATNSWNMEITESKGENTTVLIVSFPDCMKK
ncbi:MAG TPA: hypothetical protein VK808_04125 [Bacteroidia bacterium]|jgi:hypothetical protein|nr:hypothetical protein [Bacteroidia bacterium]